jgi:hypothetical protein
LRRLTSDREDLNHEEKLWLIDTINNELSIEGKEKLYALLIVFNRRQTQNDIYDPKEPFYDIEKIKPCLQKVWYKFTKMHLVSQKDDRRRKKLPVKKF